MPHPRNTTLAVELKDPRPAPFGNDTPAEKPRPINIPPKGIVRNSDSYPCGLILLLRGPTKNSEDLAMFDNYPLTRKNSRYDLNSDIDLLWGDFQNPLFLEDIMH